MPRGRPDRGRAHGMGVGEVDIREVDRAVVDVGAGLGHTAGDDRRGDDRGVVGAGDGDLDGGGIVEGPR